MTTRVFKAIYFEGYHLIIQDCYQDSRVIAYRKGSETFLNSEAWEFKLTEGLRFQISITYKPLCLYACLPGLHMLRGSSRYESKVDSTESRSRTPQKALRFINNSTHDKIVIINRKNTKKINKYKNDCLPRRRTCKYCSMKHYSFASVRFWRRSSYRSCNSRRNVLPVGDFGSYITTKTLHHQKPPDLYIIDIPQP